MRVKILAWVVVFVVSACAVVQATTLREEEVTCPVCDLTFKAFGVMSTNSSGGQDTDFCVHARGTPPGPYSVWTCPKCYYSKSASDFAAGVNEQTKKKILAELKPPWPIKEDMSQKDIPGWAKFDLLAIVAQWEGANEADLAGIYLQASWAARLELERCFQPLYEDKEQRRMFEDRSDVLDLIGTVLYQDEALRPRLEGFSEKVRGLWQEVSGGDLRSMNPKDLDMKVAQALLAEVAAGELSPADSALQEFEAAALYRARGENGLAVPMLQRLQESEVLPPPFRAVSGNMLESIEIERRFQREALEMVEEAIEKGLLKDEALAVHQYLAGELLRRLEEPERAASWYQSALESESVPTHIMAMAEAALKSIGVEYEVSEENRLASRKRAVDKLIAALNDPETADFAARQLGALADPLAVPGVIEAMKHEDAEVRASAARAFQWLPDESGAAVDALCDLLLNDPDEDVRAAAASSLADIASEKSKDALIEALLKGTSVYARENAARALGNIGNPSAGPALMQALDDEYFMTQGAAVRALGIVGYPECIPRLMEALGRYYRGEDPAVAGGIVGCVDENEEALCLITNTWFWPQEYPLDLAERKALRDRAYKEFQAWWEANKDKSPEEWVLSGFRRAGYAIEDLAEQESIPVLIRALEDERRAVRFNALKTLRNLTGQSFGWVQVPSRATYPRIIFESGAGLKQWEQWWEENKPKQ